MVKIELEPAWGWTCPECAERNFSESVVCELTPDEQAEVRIKTNNFEAGPGDFLRLPSLVTCLRCFEEFEVYMEWKEDDDDD